MPHKKNPDVFETHARQVQPACKDVPNEIALLDDQPAAGLPPRSATVEGQSFFLPPPTLAELPCRCAMFMLQQYPRAGAYPRRCALRLPLHRRGRSTGWCLQGVPFREAYRRVGLEQVQAANGTGRTARGAPYPRREYRQSLQRPHPRQDGTRDGAVRVGRDAVGTRVRDFGNENPANFKF